ncbi:hypothetical protein EIK76_03710 [Rheinheimera mesophila]|uniref:Uncharacterized protein n=1 Tax=Rheinheimera mesophila TaxID=1547515 RepID=A0A3P3QSH1_9GAMM|nr:hypothetical protein [Rheinheimera mesophila]KKL01552.1 hypothetical protein SD53_09510 [Rheinheimera mesophila]RRJ23203.1 hypothetical protein EIK76_03710 [Rheinheimera mesophila]
MDSELFQKRIDELPVAPLISLAASNCQHLKVIVAGNAPAALLVANEIKLHGAEVIGLLTEGDLCCNFALLSDSDLQAGLYFDLMLFTGDSALKVAEKYKVIRHKSAIYKHELKSFSENIELLCDLKSKRVLFQQEQMLNQNFYIEGFSDEAGEQYAHPQVHAVSGEKVLCIGPYLGKPLQAFAVSANHSFTAHCLEANPYTYAELCINIVSWKMQHQVRPVCAGAWSSTGMVAFASEGHTGGGVVLALDEQHPLKPGEIDLAIFTYSVDDYIKESGFVPTLIESGRIGIAYDVVTGARQTIETYKPKLIILDYPDSKVPALLKQWVPDYKIYYSECGRVNYGVFFFGL